MVAGPDALITFPETVVVQPLPVVMPEPALKLAAKARPSDIDLVTLVSGTYGVSMLHATQWLVEFDAAAVEAELADLASDCPF